MTTPTRETTALNRAVAAQIRSLLGIRMMRQSQLATRMGVTEVWLSRRLREVQAMSLDDVERIAQALEVEPIELLSRATRAEGRDKSGKVPATRRPRDTRPKGRADTVLANRRTTQKRALTAEELTLIEG